MKKRQNKQLPQKLLRHLKCHCTFWDVEFLRERLSSLRKNITKKEFIILCIDLVRDLDNYGNR